MDGRTFLLDYSYAGHSAEIKQQIVDMAMNASGIRDAARVLHASSTNVIKELKKRAGVAASESWGAGVLASRASRSGNRRADELERGTVGSALSST